METRQTEILTILRQCLITRQQVSLADTERAIGVLEALIRLAETLIDERQQLNAVLQHAAAIRDGYAALVERHTGLIAALQRVGLVVVGRWRGDHGRYRLEWVYRWHDGPEVGSFDTAVDAFEAALRSRLLADTEGAER